MAHFAKLGLNNKVLKTVGVDSSVLDPENSGTENENLGKQFLERLHGWPQEYWIQCSYNTHDGKYWDRNETGRETEGVQSKKLRANFPSVGWFYDEDSDIFHPAKPTGYDSWTLNTTTGQWEAPIAYPTVLLYTSGSDEFSYKIEWDESNSRWVAATEDSETNNKVWNASTSAWDDL